MEKLVIFFAIAALPSCFGANSSTTTAAPTITPAPSCNQTLIASSGVVTSPGYPARYPHNTVCNTNITVPAGKVVQLTFNTFDLEGESGSSCLFDYLRIIDGSDRIKLCGISMATYVSKSNELRLVFHSDSSFNGNGFNISFMAVLASASGCNQSLNSSSGEVTSPGYPAKYPHNKDCTTKITVPAGNVVQLTFDTFDVEIGYDCPFDYLMIVDGSNRRKLCGNRVSTYISKTNELDLVFHSDSPGNGNGFKIYFMALEAPTVAPTIPPVPPKVNEAFCGQVKVQQSRVIGGSNATKGAWPWQIGLFTSGGRFFCGGSIINPQWAVTAAHCVKGDSPSDLFIKIGDWDLYNNDGTEQRVDVEKIIMHARYNLNG
eukprot:gene17802-19578_t